MNDARIKVEDFKRHNRFPGIGMAALEINLPENYESMSYHEKNRAYELAVDKAIAKHLKVELTDVETWQEERNKAMTDEWAEKLPDIK